MIQFKLLPYFIPLLNIQTSYGSTDSRRRCANCGTYKSAGKWRRDRENYANYLCNKCGMNQRRASVRYFLSFFHVSRKANEAKLMNSSQTAISASGESIGDTAYRSGGRRGARPKTVHPECSRCNQPFPSLEVEPCKHRFCGECIPALVHEAIGKKSLECPECKADSPDALPVLIATAILGGFLLDNFDQN